MKYLKNSTYFYIGKILNFRICKVSCVTIIDYIKYIKICEYLLFFLNIS